ncbi:ATP-binding protein [Paraburkholderia sp. RL18-103-BIB-C]|uniref:ATP-binding protein n=1 Tax=Paraburkholderia sp. RL18-103-BIB-C TaxID=3031637 RepID=UPI0038B8BF44
MKSGNSIGRAKKNKSDAAQSEDDLYKLVPVNAYDDPIFGRKATSVSACYHASTLELPENANNPMILALPRLEEQKEFASAMSISFAVHHPENARNLSGLLRLLAIERISNVLVVTEPHLKLIDWLHIALRHRYRGLLPTRSLRELAQSRYEATQRGETCAIYPVDDSHADCIFIPGISGAGKTTTVKMVLSMFPMIVEHTEFSGISARFAQVVWIFVSCPANGSVATLMKGILHWFDIHLGTNYVGEMRSGANTGDWIAAVVDKINKHLVGMIVIDEIQFAVKSADKVHLLDFITGLLNDGKCLFVLVGTPDAGDMIKATIHNLRRVASRAYISLDLFPGPEASLRLAKKITQIDFLREAPLNSDAVNEALIEVGAGSPAFMKLAWVHTQYAGHRAGESRVTPALIREAVKEPFSLVEGLLGALRRKDLVALDQYRDTAIKQIADIREKMLLDQERSRLALTAGEDEASKKFSRCVDMLIKMDWPQIEAEAFVRSKLTADASMPVREMIALAVASKH